MNNKLPKAIDKIVNALLRDGETEVASCISNKLDEFCRVGHISEEVNNSVHYTVTVDSNTGNPQTVVRNLCNDTFHIYGVQTISI